MVEAPDFIQSSGLTIPQDHLDACRAQNIPTVGNAAANTEDYFDLAGANEAVAPLPEGFTARGIVALVFSIVAAFIGLAAVSWYGAGDIGRKEPGAVARNVVEETRNVE